ncbi:MAG: hypothetical protein AAGG68_03425 [Bacteroidota bacterium]
MSTRYKIHDQNTLYFLKLTTVDWIDVFTRKEYRDILLKSRHYCQKQKGLVLNTYVIMIDPLNDIGYLFMG